MGLLDITVNRRIGQVDVNNNLLVTSVGAYAIANICGITFSQKNYSYKPELNKKAFWGFLIASIASAIAAYAASFALLWAAAVIFALIALIIFCVYKSKKGYSYNEYFVTFTFSNGNSVMLNSFSQNDVILIGEEVAKVIQSRGKYVPNRTFELQTIKVENNNITNIAGNLNSVIDSPGSNINIDSGNTTNYQQAAYQQQQAAYQQAYQQQQAAYQQAYQQQAAYQQTYQPQSYE